MKIITLVFIRICSQKTLKKLINIRGKVFKEALCFYCHKRASANKVQSGPISRILCGRARSYSPWPDSHFSRQLITEMLKPSTRRQRMGHALSLFRLLPAYLRLLPVGFAMPAVSPPLRYALAVPFHPYLIPAMQGHRRSALCCTFRQLWLAPPLPGC